ncbi:MAG: hypothetical protein P8171_24405 [Candidatus Thiodiazotropha sp.]
MLGPKPALLSIAIALPIITNATQVQAGAACVVAKRLGNSLAIEWLASPEVNAAGAITRAQNRLIEQGYRTKGQDVHAQAHTELRHAFVVIIKTRYMTAIGTTRTSYGCGYAANSKAQAERAAVYDLRNYSWGWKPEFGYEVMETFRY